jgi:hypothetical protein
VKFIPISEKKYYALLVLIGVTLVKLLVGLGADKPGMI